MNAGQVDEVSAAIWAKLFQGLPSYDPGKGRFRAWLGTVVRNAALSHYRHVGRHPDHQDGTC